MSDIALSSAIPAIERPKLDHPVNPMAIWGFLAILAAGLLFVAYSIKSMSTPPARPVVKHPPLPPSRRRARDRARLRVRERLPRHGECGRDGDLHPFVAAPVAVVWSGLCNLSGVLWSTGAVAFGIISLLPVELILQVGSGAGFAMVFALLIAAIIWNLGTWWLGLPASSSHTLIGSIIGVGIMNALMRGRDGTSGVDWDQAYSIGKTLLISPIVGFVASALLLLIMKALIRNPALYKAPESAKSPPWWISGLLIFTCTGVSFAHGSNDGQKGMGLIMLILIGTVPTAYALNRALPDSRIATFQSASEEASKVIEGKAAGYDVIGNPRPAVSAYISSHQISEGHLPVAAALVARHRQAGHGTTARSPRSRPPKSAIPATTCISPPRRCASFPRTRRASFRQPTSQSSPPTRRELDASTKFIPLWVKIAVAIALGLGTMIGWKRIVVTVGEKIGKTHLTYGQGAAAELVAMATILAADNYGLPVSTTHVLSSGVAGTMAANGSGIQLSTLRNIAMAWVLTLPAAMILSGALYFLFSKIF